MVNKHSAGAVMASENTSEQMRTLMIRMEGVNDAVDKEGEDDGADPLEGVEGEIEVVGEKTQAQLDADAREIVAKKNKFFGTGIMDMFKRLSREAIVFVKGLGTHLPLKWTTIAGDAYADEVNNKVFLPITIIGQPMNSRSLNVSYKMNLELLTIEGETLK